MDEATQEGAHAESSHPGHSHHAGLPQPLSGVQTGGIVSFSFRMTSFIHSCAVYLAGPAAQVGI